MKIYVMVGVCNKGYVYCDYLKFNSYLGIKKDWKKRWINWDNEIVWEIEIWL